MPEIEQRESKRDLLDRFLVGCDLAGHKSIVISCGKMSVVKNGHLVKGSVEPENLPAMASIELRSDSAAKELKAALPPDRT